MKQIDMQSIVQKSKELWQRSLSVLGRLLNWMNATPERSRRAIKWLLVLLLLATILGLMGCAGNSVNVRPDCPSPKAPPADLMAPPKTIYLLKQEQLPLRLQKSVEKPNETPPPAR